MPRYFFDSEGDELADLDAAREEGRRSARELMGLDHGEPNQDYDGATFEITGADGAILAVTRFAEGSLEDVRATVVLSPRR